MATKRKTTRKAATTKRIVSKTKRVVSRDLWDVVANIARLASNDWQAIFDRKAGMTNITHSDYIAKKLRKNLGEARAQWIGGPISGGVFWIIPR